MQAYGGEDCQETARFIGLMDRFFDCLNSRSLEEAERKRKPDLAPYRSEMDERFEVIFFNIKLYFFVDIMVSS